VTTTQEAHSALALVVVLRNAGEAIPPELLNMAGMTRPPETLPELRTRYALEGGSAKVRFVDSLIAGTPDREALRECGGHAVQVNDDA
jgi:hypothetical protein